MTGPLGKKVDAPSSFAPEILFSISRDEQRYEKQLINQDGVDIWNIHELFWVDKKGHAYHDEVSIHIPAQSPNTVESKSLKLFINSLIHQSEFSAVGAMRDHLSRVRYKTYDRSFILCDCY